MWMRHSNDYRIKVELNVSYHDSCYVRRCIYETESDLFVW